MRSVMEAIKPDAGLEILLVSTYLDPQTGATHVATTPVYPSNAMASPQFMAGADLLTRAAAAMVGVFGRVGGSLFAWRQEYIQDRPVQRSRHSQGSPLDVRDIGRMLGDEPRPPVHHVIGTEQELDSDAWAPYESEAASSEQAAGSAHANALVEQTVERVLNARFSPILEEMTRIMNAFRVQSTRMEQSIAETERRAAGASQAGHRADVGSSAPARGQGGNVSLEQYGACPGSVREKARAIETAKASAGQSGATEAARLPDFAALYSLSLVSGGPAAEGGAGATPGAMLCSTHKLPPRPVCMLCGTPSLFGVCQPLLPRLRLMRSCGFFALGSRALPRP